MSDEFWCPGEATRLTVLLFIINSIQRFQNEKAVPKAVHNSQVFVRNLRTVDYLVIFDQKLYFLLILYRSGLSFAGHTRFARVRPKIEIPQRLIMVGTAPNQVINQPEMG